MCSKRFRGAKKAKNFAFCPPSRPIFRAGKTRKPCFSLFALRKRLLRRLVLTLNAKPAFLIFSSWKTFFERFRFRDGLLWTVGLIVKGDFSKFKTCQRKCDRSDLPRDMTELWHRKCSTAFHSGLKFLALQFLANIPCCPRRLLLLWTIFHFAQMMNKLCGDVDSKVFQWGKNPAVSGCEI